MIASGELYETCSLEHEAATGHPATVHTPTDSKPGNGAQRHDRALAGAHQCPAGTVLQPWSEGEFRCEEH